MNVCTRIEAGSTNGRKREAWDDVTMCFPSTKQQFQSLEHWNVKYAIKVNKISSTYIVSAFLWAITI